MKICTRQNENNPMLSSLNLGLKLEPLTTAHVGLAKRFLRVLVSFKLLKPLMKPVRITFNV